MDILSALGSSEQPAELVCSRKGCRMPASHKILWNNPKIHTPERRKIWLACAEHRPWLENYLGERLLYKETQPIAGATLTDQPAPSDDAAKE